MERFDTQLASGGMWEIIGEIWKGQYNDMTDSGRTAFG